MHGPLNVKYNQHPSKAVACAVSLFNSQTSYISRLMHFQLLIYMSTSLALTVAKASVLLL